MTTTLNVSIYIYIYSSSQIPFDKKGGPYIQDDRKGAIQLLIYYA